MNTYRFVIIGFGHIGSRHAEVISTHPACELVAVIDDDPAAKGRMPEAWNIPFFENFQEFLQANIHADIVNICTPNGIHAINARTALISGYHVVIEKPMGLNRRSCEEVIQTAMIRNKKVFGVMQNRYSPPSRWLKELVTSGKLGKPYMVQINCYWNRGDRYYKESRWKGTLEMDGGPLFTQFSHFMDTLYWLFGDIDTIQARFANFAHHYNTAFEDSGFVTFALENGGLGSFNYSTCAHEQNLESSMTILAEKGTVKVSGQYMERVEHCRVQDYEMPELPEPPPPNQYPTGAQGSASNHYLVIDNVVNTLNGNSEETTNAMEGLKVVDMIERIYALRPPELLTPVPS